MEKWEYNTLIIYSEDIKDANGKKHEDWVVRISDGTQIVGLTKILDRYGSEGWELVNLISEEYTPNDVIGYRAVFKRKLA